MCVNIVHFQDAPGSNTASRWGEGNLTSLWFLLHYTDRCLDVTSILLELECTFAQGGRLLVTKTKHQSDGIPQLAGRTGLTEFPIYSVSVFTTLGMTCICIAVSKYSRNHFISEKYKTVQWNRDSTVAKVLLYKSEGRWFDPRWYHWNFSLT